jgi:hypothetical protein
LKAQQRSKNNIATMQLGALIFFILPPLALTHPLLNHTTIPHRPEIHDGKTLLTDMKRTLIRTRDSITIKISNSFFHTIISNAQNNAKFEVVSNAKNAAAALGDNSTDDVTLDSFGDENILNSTGSNTGRWNTKNHGSNLSMNEHKKRNPEYLLDYWNSNSTDRSLWKPGGTHIEYKEGKAVVVSHIEHKDPNAVPAWYTMPRAGWGRRS